MSEQARDKGRLLDMIEAANNVAEKLPLKALYLYGSYSKGTM